MKKYFIGVCLLIICAASTASAEWTEDFTKLYLDNNIDDAVEEALKQGATPEAIIELAGQIEGLTPSELIKALYCAGISPSLIAELSSQFNIPEAELVAGYKRSVRECGPALSRTFNPLDTTRNRAGGGTPASPNRF